MKKQISHELVNQTTQLTRGLETLKSKLHFWKVRKCLQLLKTTQSQMGFKDEAVLPTFTGRKLSTLDSHLIWQEHIIWNKVKIKRAQSIMKVVVAVQIREVTRRNLRSFIMQSALLPEKKHYLWRLPYIQLNLFVFIEKKH